MTEFGENASAAVQFVQEGHTKFLEKSDLTLSQAIAQVTNLSNFTATPLAFSVGFNFDGQLAGFTRPNRPLINTAEFALQPQEAPTLPPGFDVQSVDLGEQPLFDVVTPTFAFGPRPDALNVAMPVKPAVPSMPGMPGVPDWQAFIPQPVTLRELNLPTLAPITLPTFNAQRPTIDPFRFDANFNFTPEDYVSALLTKIQGRVSTWLDGQEALPQAIVRALTERARGRIQVEVASELEQAEADYVARGWPIPTGLLDARRDAIRQKGQDRYADASRDIALKEFDEALANMRLAVSSGIQLEGMTINLHLEEQKLLLASMQFLVETSLAVLNARIAQYNAEMQGLAIEAQVFKVELEAALATLEEYRLRIEAEKLAGEINESTVRLYGEQWNAVKSLADFYRTQVEAVKVQADTLRIPIEIFAEECRAFETVHSARAKEWDGYRASIEGETSKATLYRAQVDAFATRSDAVVKRGGLALDAERLRHGAHERQVAVYNAGLQRLGLLLDNEKARLAAVGQRASAEALIYRAAADVETAASAAIDRTFQLGLERERAIVDTQLQTAKIRSDENVALQGLTLEALKAIAQVLSQLAASTMSAVNYGAHVSASDSFSHSRSVGWSGDADDWNPTFV